MVLLSYFAKIKAMKGSKKTNKRKSKGYQGKRTAQKEKPVNYPVLTYKAKRWIWASILFLAALVIALSFFGRAGAGGNLIFQAIYFLMGKTIFFVPLLLCLSAIIFLKPCKKRIYLPVFLGSLFLILGIAGIFSAFDISSQQAPETFSLSFQTQGGLLGYLISFPLAHFFGFLVAFLCLSLLLLIGSIIVLEFLPKKKPQPEAAPPKKELQPETIDESEKEELKIEIKDISQKPGKLKQEAVLAKEAGLWAEPQPLRPGRKARFKYQSPPLEFLEREREKALAGDIQANCELIKKTLKNFGIQVQMGEVNVGPTVTQYTLKPAEGIKLSKITALKNDLALALAAHPLRIEAPIPGRSLVGVEVPNKVRAYVRMRDLISLSAFQSAPPLTFCLGRNVKGAPLFTDLGRMPHLLVAGATGSGKTIALNSLVLSLIWRSSPQVLKLILIDPKRVEFPVYNSLPHLLTPVIFNAQKTLNALNWLLGEMDRRFDILGKARARDIGNFNELLFKDAKLRKNGFEIMPYIVLIIDELADLMAQKGREIEAGIVRIAQMARAVGIHLVVATQRPSVEVITGLIKANITSRIAFQVASQVDSRTILDMAGAEALLGRGDMLFISAEFSQPKRVQGVYVSMPEVKKVVSFLERENKGLLEERPSGLQESLERELEQAQQPSLSPGGPFSQDDPLYEEAKRVVREANKASASLLQRRLKIGYARAARILDILEERGVVGPQDGAKPRKVFGEERRHSNQESDWQSV